MSVKKQFLKSRPVCKVTFKLSKDEARHAASVRVLGDFNDWKETETPMKRLKSGAFTATIELPVQNRFEFRYLLDEREWENDWQADAYSPSPMSWEDNSVIHT